jgi:hypothetical protein
MRCDSPDDGHDGDFLGRERRDFYIMRHDPRRRYTIARARLMARPTDLPEIMLAVQVTWDARSV